ncbi:MAG: ATPase protein [Mucilaginibacter sp.]|jgi:DNA primase|nr:ATPase protein [Mucilaginibacter sp.]
MPSTVVASMKYDPEKATLRVVFVSGMIYDYKNVPEEEYIRMKTSGSKGIYLNKHIKGKYEFEKVKDNAFS